jgi:hypothetical protein
LTEGVVVLRVGFIVDVVAIFKAGGFTTVVDDLEAEIMAGGLTTSDSAKTGAAGSPSKKTDDMSNPAVTAIGILSSFRDADRDDDDGILVWEGSTTKACTATALIRTRRNIFDLLSVIEGKGNDGRG